jgi:peroxiredoxin
LFALTGGRSGHPGHDALADRARRDREDTSFASARVDTHLKACDACAAEVAFLRRVGEAASEMRAPVASRTLLDRVLTQRARGVTFELPLDHHPAAPRRSAVAIAALAAAASVIAAVVVTSPREGTASATGGELRFSVPFVHPGERVTVSYRPAAELAGRDSLVLRGRFRGEADEAYGQVARSNEAVAVLEPSGTGTFVGSFAFPESAVHGMFVVESSDAYVVDHHGKKLWELLATTHSSRERVPSFEALHQRSEAYLGRSWDEAFAATKEGVRRYPDRAESWQSLLFYEKSLLGERAEDSLRRVHLPRLREFDVRLRREAKPSAEEMNAMLFYALSLKDSVVGTYWSDRLIREQPTSPVGMQARLTRVWPTVMADTVSRRKLAEFEKLYTSAAHDPTAFQRQGFAVVRLGLDIALDAKDSALAVRWAGRYLAAQGSWGDSAYVSTRLVELPQLRQSQLDRLRYFARTAVAARLAARPLDFTLPQWRSQLERRRATLYAAIGKALVAAGQPAAGADTLERAALASWSIPLFRDAAAAWLRAGDSVRARQQMARMAVDPSMTDATRDSLAVAAGRPSAWADWTAAAREQMRAVLLHEGTRKVVRGAPRLVSLDGGQVKLASLTRGRPTVVTFWSRYCGPSLEELPAVEKVWRELDARGIGMVAITDEMPSKELRAFLEEQKLTFPVYLDTRRDATNGFDNFGTPNYYILDADGVVRFDQRELQTVVRNASLLLPEPHSIN